MHKKQLIKFILSLVYCLIGCAHTDNSGFVSYGDKHSGEGDYHRAIAYYSEALKINPKDAETYYKRGLAHAKASKYDNAVEDLSRALELNIQSHVADVYYNRAVFYHHLGELDKALEDASRAIELNPNYHDAYEERGYIYAQTGFADKAIEDLTRVIVTDPQRYLAFGVRGIAHDMLGNKELAIADFTRAIQLNPTAQLYNARAGAYKSMENLPMALKDYNMAIGIYPSYGVAYFNRGNVYSKLGNTDKAIEDFTESYRLVSRSDALTSRGRLYAQKGDFARAIADYDQAILDAELEKITRKTLSNALVYEARADIYQKIGEFDKALADYKTYFEVLETDINTINFFNLNWSLTAKAYNSNPYLKGIKTTDSFTVEFINLVRRSISSGILKAEDIRSGFGTRGNRMMVERIQFYYAGVDIESVLGSKEKAFEYSESLRSRGFLEQLGTEAALRLPGITAEERNAIQTLTALRDALQNILESYAGNEPDEKYAEAGLQLTKAENDIAGLDIRIGQRIPRYTELRNPKPVDITKAKAWCGNDRAVLEYVLWDDSVYTGTNKPTINSYCLVLTQNGVTPVPLDPGFDYLKAVNDLRNQIVNDEDLSRGIAVIAPAAPNRYEQTRNSLYDKLIKPVLPHIPANTKNIVIVPDGSLMYLPFDVLRENADKPDFGESYRLSLSPSISVSVLAAKTGTRINEPLLAFGGAVYDRNSGSVDRGKRGYVNTGDGRGIIPETGALDGGAGKYYSNQLRWLNLPGTETEVRSLQNLAFTQGRPTVFTGRDVSEKKVKDLSGDGTLKTFPIIHFACHGYFNEEAPSMSGIIFSEVSGLVNTGEDGYLTIPEVALLNMDARMVVLSACETGLGQVKRGDGMVGLARSFLVAGAENVGVSLWSISDDATVEFMTRLYRKVIQQNMSFRDAYFTVRNEFRKDPKWGHPFYWAAFTMYE